MRGQIVRHAANAVRTSLSYEVVVGAGDAALPAAVIQDFFDDMRCDARYRPCRWQRTS